MKILNCKIYRFLLIAIMIMGNAKAQSPSSSRNYMMETLVRTAGRVGGSQKNKDNYGGATKAKDWFNDLGELGKTIKSDVANHKVMEQNAKENGFGTEGHDRLVELGEKRVVSDRIGVVRDFLAGKATGPSAFATAKDIVDAPKTYGDLNGKSISQDVKSVVDYIQTIPGAMKAFYDDLKSKTLNGIQSYQNGNYRGLW